VSLFVTGPGPAAEPTRFRKEHRADEAGPAPFELHAFTNCETLRLTRDGLLLGALEGALHYVVPLYGSFQQILATGSRADTVVQSMFRQHAEPSLIEITPVEATRGATVPVDLAIRDGAGVTVSDWNGSVRLTASGSARLVTLDGRGTVEMARGVGRAYLQVEPNAHEVLLTASCAGLATATVTVNLTGR
jgi:hypothetical protein